MPIVVKRKQALALVAKPRRRPGTRVGLTLPGIVSAARHVIEADGAITDKKVGERLDVTSGAIRSKLRSRGTTIEAELASQVAQEVIAPMAPNQTWEEYLVASFERAAELLISGPETARLVGPLIADLPFTLPEMTERLLHVAAEAGLPADRRLEGVDVILSALAGFLVMRSPTLDGKSLAWLQRAQDGLSKIDPLRCPLMSSHAEDLELAARAISRDRVLSDMRRTGQEAAVDVITSLLRRGNHAST